jgi:hypothetical protein
MVTGVQTCALPIYSLEIFPIVYENVAGRIFKFQSETLSDLGGWLNDLEPRIECKFSERCAVNSSDFQSGRHMCLLRQGPLPKRNSLNGNTNRIATFQQLISISPKD